MGDNHGAAGHRPVGVILAGGAGRRLGGRDKAGVELGGRTLLAHVATRLGPQCAELVLSANGDPCRFSEYGLQVLPDDLPGRPGPLAGILAALDWTAAHRPAASELMSAAVDTPFLPADLVARLMTAKSAAGAAIACAASGGRRHHVTALWSVASRHMLRSVLVSDGIRRVEDAVDRLGAVAVMWSHEPDDPFANINTPDDLARAEATSCIRTENVRSPSSCSES